MTIANKELFGWFRRILSVNIFLAVICLQSLFNNALCDSIQPSTFLSEINSKEYSVAEGNTVILECQAFGTPPPQYQWQKNGIISSDYSAKFFHRVSSAARGNGDEYRCLVNNAAGTVMTAAMKVFAAYFDPPLEVFPIELHVPAGEAAVLYLPRLQSYPMPKVTWLQETSGIVQEGGRFAIGEPEKELVILETTKADEGIYSATISNIQVGREIVSRPIHLIIQEQFDNSTRPLEIVVPPANTTVLEGTSFTRLRCIANARPLKDVEVFWHKDGTPIEDSGVRSFLEDRNRSLTLLQASLTYAGRYSCIAKFRGTQQQAEAHLRVEAPPLIKGQLPKETKGALGSSLVLDCVAIGYPPPAIRWLKDAIDISTIMEFRYRVVSNGSLIISSVIAEDSAIYECLASNTVGEVATYTWLTVRTSAPVILDPPTNQTVLDGDNVLLKCTAEGAPHPNITWTFNGQQLSPDTRYQLEPDGALRINGAGVQNEGVYECTRANTADQVTASAVVSIMVKAGIVGSPQDVRVTLGHVATFTCKASYASSVEINVKWFHNGAPFGSHAGRINVGPDGTLVIQEVRATDSGVYTCQVFSHGGNDTRSARLQVIELPYAPVDVRAERIQNSRPTVLGIGPRLPNTVRVTWTAPFDGNDPVNRFEVEHREVPQTAGPFDDDLGLNWVSSVSNVSGDSLSVLIKGMKASTAYKFRVSAVNGVGRGPPSEPSKVLLLPQEAPSNPPQRLVGSARSSSEIMIQWESPSRDSFNGVLLGYIVRYRLSGYTESRWYYRNITNSNQVSYLIGGLITWKSYEIEVAAYNNKGVGVFSIPLITSTKEGVPVGTPRKLEARAIGSDVIYVEWTAPQPYLINGINQGYKVQAWKGPPGRSSEPPVTIKVTPSPYPNAREKVNLTSLEKFTHYHVTVLCFTNPGDGPRSPSVEVTTMEDVPGKVTNLTVSDVTHRSLMLHWAAPHHQNGVLNGYTASIYKTNDVSSKINYNLTADVTYIELANLTAVTNYTLNVFAWTTIGAGAFWIKTVSTAVEPILPDPPSRLAVSNIQISSVVLQFTPGFDGNALIEKYIIEVKPGRSSTWTTHETIERSNPNTASTVVTNLMPYTEYQLRLRAYNAAGPSEPSSPSPSFQTLHADPAHGPTDVRVRAVSATELRVRWVPLQHSEWHGVPRGYSLKYRPTGCECLPSTSFVDDVAANSYTISGLEEYTLYDVTVQAVNDVGFSSLQIKPIQERTQEAAPSAGPYDVQAEATSSTTVVVRWGNVPKGHINGIIRGFKVVYGGRGLPPQVAQIDDNTTRSTTLTELRKYYNYGIQVRAFTRSGDGALSMPPVIVQTMEDVPGPPSNVSFPDVSFTYARVIWNQPREPNGEIIGYSVTYSLLTGGRRDNVTIQLGPEDRTYKAIDLHSESNYVFIIRAEGNLGWGTERFVHVYTTAHRQKPARPTRPSVGASQITSKSISFNWAVEDDGYAPIRYYEIEQRQEIPDAPWISVFVHSSLNPPLSPVYTAVELRPATPYSFRVRAANDVGLSEWSRSSLVTMTHSSAPKMFPKDVKIVPITRSDVRVSWTPLEASAWNGDVQTAGYSFAYKDASSPLATAVTVDAPRADTSQIIIENLEKNKKYEITVWAYNAKGKSPRSNPYSFFVGEAVPTGKPEDVQAQPLSPREIKISWTAPRKETLNGQLLGYKIYWKANHTSASEEVEIVKPEGTNYSISYLEPFTSYNVTMLCFNPAGEGPLSDAVTVTTLESAPQAVENLRFDDITMTSLKVSWDPPRKPNGLIRGYLVTYETARPDENFSKQVKQKVSSSQLLVESLKEEVTYRFHVRAETVSLGPAKSATVTAGPQPGSPARPKDVRLSQTVSSVTVHWRNNHPGQSPILGYYIQVKELASEGWTTIMRTSGGPAEEYAIAFQNLMPSTTYEFRISAYNAQGISHPTFIDQKIVTPSKVVLQLASPHHQPFYHQTWFVVSLAASSMVVIITVVATLCVKSSAYKYKNESANKTMDSTLTLDDPSYEMRPVHRSAGFSDQTVGCMGTSLGPSGGIAAVRSPPRPAPASVTYSDDDTMRGYDDDADDSSEVSEKPTDVSSSDTDESVAEQGAAAPSFVNHYANLNSTMRSSWQRQRPMRNYSNYTDSEAEGSGVVSLNGGQVVLNNMAGSRAPLPGFSSFV